MNKIEIPFRLPSLNQYINECIGCEITYTEIQQIKKYIEQLKKRGNYEI